MEGIPVLRDRKLWRRIAVWSGQLVLAMLAGQGFLSYRGSGIPLGDFVILTSGMIVISAVGEIVKTSRRSADQAA